MMKVIKRNTSRTYFPERIFGLSCQFRITGGKPVFAIQNLIPDFGIKVPWDLTDTIHTVKIYRQFCRCILEFFTQLFQLTGRGFDLLQRKNCGQCIQFGKLLDELWNILWVHLGKDHRLVLRRDFLHQSNLFVQGKASNETKIIDFFFIICFGSNIFNGISRAQILRPVAFFRSHAFNRGSNFV